MARRVAFLRGINLPGRRVGRDALAACFEGMGFSDVETFRASGNVIFDAGDGAPAKLTARIERGLGESLGYDVKTFLRTEDQVRAIAESRPFDRALVEASRGKLQVAMLSAQPAKAVRTEVLALGTEDDRLAFGDRELYWLPSGGTQHSALNLAAIEKRVGAWTMRTLGTVEQIAAKFFGD